jgi:hypothetical protein
MAQLYAMSMRNSVLKLQLEQGDVVTILTSRIEERNN